MLSLRSFSMFIAAGILFCSAKLLLAQYPPVNSAAPIAIQGNPFGVWSAEVPLPPQSSDAKPRVLVEAIDGEIFYPAVSVRYGERLVSPPPPSGPPLIGRRGGLIDRVRSAIRGQPKKEKVPVALVVSGLFRGGQNLSIRIVGDITQTIRIPVQAEGSPDYSVQLAAWWERYMQQARDAIGNEDFPKLVHLYLTNMLADRLSLPARPLEEKDPEEEDASQPLKTLALLAAIEPLREDILEEVISRPPANPTASQPVPAEPLWQAAQVPTLQPPAIEELATRVPPECFYLRFGNFSNYVWFQELSERYGGDIGQAVLLRGFNYEASKRMERMLASKLTTVAKMFGDKLVNDMAIVGSDLYMKEGASLGVVFSASNVGLLAGAIESDRKAALKKNPDASLTSLELAGKQVSLLSTPDNRIRAFYVVDGDFIFVSTSKALTERFLQVGAGQTSLADTPAFRATRSWMPEANDYSVFAYFSPDFFHRLVSPAYQIELRRRLEAIAHIELAEVALQAAEAEGIKSATIEQLQQQGFLPPWFDQRPDGARVLRTNTALIDSLRGRRGSFLPIADVQIDGVSEQEAAGYAEIADFYTQQWQQMDPLMVGIRRFRGEGNKEKIAFEGYIAPFTPEKYGWLAAQLGEPTPIELQLPADDAVSVQTHVKGAATLGISSGDYHLFGGIKDMLPPSPTETEGLIKTLQTLRATPAYIGAWPKPGIIEQLPITLGLARPDYAGFSRMIGGLWRWQSADFSLLSFDRSILDNAIPQLGVREVNDFAQVRAKIANLDGSKLSIWINQQWYQRGWKASHGNAVLLDTVHQQLKVPGEQCLDVTQRLLDVKLQCPLGGEYTFEPLPSSGGGWWRSTAWPEAARDDSGRPMPPPNYEAPWIDWFRGGKFHLTQRPDSLAVVGTVDLEMQPFRASVDQEQKPDLLPPMDFDLFELPFKLFGDDKKTPPKPERKSF